MPYPLAFALVKVLSNYFEAKLSHVTESNMNEVVM